MKAIEWQRFFQEQQDRYRKTVFTTTELANADSSSPASVKAALQRLVAHNIIERCTDGRFALPGTVTMEALIPTLDSSAYVTGMYTLYRRQLITQAPIEIHCFTRRRHNRSRVRNTSVGRIVFITVSANVYAYPTDSIFTGPEQALCDTIYLYRRRGLDASGLVTFRNLNKLNIQRLEKILSRYPKTTGRAVLRLLNDNP